MIFTRFVTLFSLAVVNFGSTTQAQTLRTVALSDTNAPGTPSGVVFEFFDAPSINNVGQTAFRGILTGTDIVEFTNDGGIWSEGSGSLSLVARDGDQAPGFASEAEFDAIRVIEYIPILNDAGQTGFTSRVRIPGDTSRHPGIWAEDSNILGLVLPPNDQAPGTPAGTLFNFADDYAFNASEQFAFRGVLKRGFGGATSDDDTGIWSHGPGTLTLIAREGDQVPGMPAGVVFGNFSRFIEPAINASGYTAFTNYVSGPGIEIANRAFVWVHDKNNLNAIARAGDQAPGLPDGVKFDFFQSDVRLNELGQTAFYAELTGTGVDSTNEDSIWSESTGSLTLVARTGQQAPGTPDGVFFSSLWTELEFNSTGHIVFRGVVDGPGIDFNDNAAGIWSDASGSIQLIARQGSQAAGAPVGHLFSGIGEPTINSFGQIAFWGSLKGSGVNGTNNFAIWAQDQSDTLRMIVRTGDSLEVAPGDHRTISYLEFLQGPDNDSGYSNGFNNLGQVAFKAEFTDGSQGLFVSNLVAIPEPGSILLAAMALSVFLVRKR